MSCEVRKEQILIKLEEKLEWELEWEQEMSMSCRTIRSISTSAYAFESFQTPPLSSTSRDPPNRRSSAILCQSKRHTIEGLGLSIQHPRSSLQSNFWPRLLPKFPITNILAIVNSLDLSISFSFWVAWEGGKAETQWARPSIFNSHSLLSFHAHGTAKGVTVKLEWAVHVLGPVPQCASHFPGHSNCKPTVRKLIICLVLHSELSVMLSKGTLETTSKPETWGCTECILPFKILRTKESRVMRQIHFPKHVHGDSMVTQRSTQLWCYHSGQASWKEPQNANLLLARMIPPLNSIYSSSQTGNCPTRSTRQGHLQWSFYMLCQLGTHL